MKSYCVFRDCEMLQIILSKSVSGTSRVAFFLNEKNLDTSIV